MPAGLFFVAFVAGVLEKHPVTMFVEEPADAPPAYAAAMVHEAAVRHGFVWRAAGRHTRFSTLTATLLLSPELGTLAIVSQGTILNMPTKKTILLTNFVDGSLILTVDEAGTAELDPRTERYILMNADFAELWSRYYQAVSARREQIVPFASDASWPAVDAIYRERVERMVAAGNARYVDGDATRYRYTPSAAFNATFVHGLKQIFTPRNLWRNLKPRPGTLGGAPPPVATTSVPPPLPTRSGRSGSRV